jgi:APA family basic amino acid/polyamine antiporter
MAGFLVGWLSFFAIFAGTIATLAVGFAAGLGAFFDLDTPVVLGIAVLAIIGTSALNHLGVRWGALANNITGYLKVVALLGLGVVAPLTGKGSVENLRPLVDGIASAAPPLAFALALSPVLFSFLGWNASIYVASEIRKPGRNLPLSLFVGLGICTAVYLVMNVVYLYALPVADLGQVENAGEATARVLFGALGGSLLAVFVLASILGTLNAHVLLGPRIAYAMALDHLFFGGVDRVHAGYHTPAVAIWVQAGVAIALVLVLRTFPNALDYTTFSILVHSGRHHRRHGRPLCAAPAPAGPASTLPGLGVPLGARLLHRGEPAHRLEPALVSPPRIADQSLGAPGGIALLCAVRGPPAPRPVGGIRHTPPDLRPPLAAQRFLQ